MTETSAPPRPRDDVAANVRAALARAGLSQWELARRLGVSHQWVWRRITASPRNLERAELTTGDLARIAANIGCQVRELTR